VNGVFSQDYADCDGSALTTFTNTACSIPLSVLTAAPYSLAKGQSVYAEIIATNYFGNSTASTAGNGGVVVLVPDAPLTLTNNALVTNAFQIGFTWLEGLSNGGTSV